MPQMANITVLNAAGGSVVYTAATPSSGDRVAAVWRANALAVNIANRPKFSVSTRDNTRKDGRVLNASFQFPITGTDANTGQEIILATFPCAFNGTLPTNVDAAKVADGFTQMGNLIASALIRAVAAEGYAPT